MSASMHRLLTKQSVAQAAVLISILSALSKVIGFLREVVIAREFGATWQTDAFLVGMMVPNLVLGIAAGGLTTLIIPWYLGNKKENPEHARLLVNQVTVVWGTMFAVVCVGVYIWAPQLVHLFASGFTGERYQLAVLVTRLLVPMGFMVIMSGICTGLLHAESSFLIPLLWTVIGNAAIVICLLAFSSRLGIHAWTLGQTLSAAIGFLPLVIVLARRYDMFHHVDLPHIEWPALLQFAALLVPLILAGGVASLNTVVDRWVASRLPVGSISAINYSGRVWGIPITLLAGPLATATFPSISALATNPADLRKLDNTIRSTASFIAWLIIPSSVGLIVLAQPLVRLLFQRGAFDAAATGLTAACVQMYALGLVGQSLLAILQRVFYAFKDTVTPLLIGVGIVGTNMAGNIILSRFMGAPGIALSTSITVMLGCLLYATLMRRFFRGENTEATAFPLMREFLKTCIASVPVGVIAFIGRRWLQPVTAFVPLAARTILIVIAAALAYGLCSIVLHCNGWEALRRRLVRLLPFQLHAPAK
jgi:putative peptidoglycan lipid II flippase